MTPVPSSDSPERTRLCRIPRRGSPGPLGTTLLFAASLCASRADRVPWTSSRIAGSPEPPPACIAEPAFPQVRLTNPVQIVRLPGSSRWIALEQQGQLKSFIDRPDAARAELLLNLRQHHQPFDSAYGFTFHPGFGSNHFIFVCYVEPGGRTNGSFVSRFTVSMPAAAGSPPAIDPASELPIIRWYSGGHNGGDLKFGPDGMLYISTGDAASPDPPDEFHTGQGLNDLLSCVLRIDVDHPQAGRNYSIPSDNPFVNTPGARGEIFAFGFRNPWRMSFGPDGALYVGDVGWEMWEMIHRVRSGGNHGWSVVEGPNPNVRTDVAAGPGAIIPPLVVHPHSEAASITGGLHYRGKRMPRLAGQYIYGDWETGKIWALRHEGDRLISVAEICDTPNKIVDFCEDADGEILVLDYNGPILRLVANNAGGSAPEFPRTLSRSGLFENANRRQPAPGVVPFRIAAPMWNDHAVAERLLAVPGAAEVLTRGGPGNIAGGTWNFPTNTVLARTLTLEMETGRPESGRAIETQLLHWDGQGWRPYTYRWNARQSDADLVPSSGMNEVFTVKDPQAPGGRREIPWRFAGRAECQRCHNPWAGETLALSWVQLNTPGSEPEWQRLQNLGVLRVAEPPGQLPRLADPYDPNLPTEHRARSWLHVNCATCHRMGAGAGVLIQFNLDQPIQKSRAYDVKPSRGDFGLAAARILAPGDPFRSTMFYRVCTEGAGHMPVIGSRLVDETGIGLLRDWLRSLPPAADAPATNAATLVNDLSSADAASRLEAARRLLATPNGALAVAGSMTKLDPGIIRIATEDVNAGVRDLFERFVPAEKRRRTLGLAFDPQAVLSLRGQAGRGRTVFSQAGGPQCARCHTAGGVGRNFGPDLGAIGKKYPRTSDLLDQIVHPSKVIAPEFVLHNVETKDGLNVGGFVLKKSPGELVLRTEAQGELRLSTATIESDVAAQLSAMPDGLLQSLTAQEAADLLAFLMEPK